MKCDGFSKWDALRKRVSLGSQVHATEHGCMYFRYERSRANREAQARNRGLAVRPPLPVLKGYSGCTMGTNQREALVGAAQCNCGNSGRAPPMPARPGPFYRKESPSTRRLCACAMPIDLGCDRTGAVRHSALRSVWLHWLGNVGALWWALCWGTLVGTLLGYSVAQAALAEAQHSHDPNVLGAFVAAHPSHPEGLLQVGG